MLKWSIAGVVIFIAATPAVAALDVAPFVQELATEGYCGQEIVVTLDPEYYQSTISKSGLPDTFHLSCPTPTAEERGAVGRLINTVLPYPDVKGQMLNVQEIVRRLKLQKTLQLSIGTIEMQ